MSQRSKSSKSSESNERDQSPVRKSAVPTKEQFFELLTKWLGPVKELYEATGHDFANLFPVIRMFCCSVKAPISYPICVAALAEHTYESNYDGPALQFFLEPVMGGRFKNQELANEFWSEIPDVIKRYQLEHIEFWSVLSLYRYQGRSFLTLNDKDVWTAAYTDPTKAFGYSLFPSMPKILFTPTPDLLRHCMFFQELRSEPDEDIKSRQNDAQAALERLNLLLVELLPSLVSGGSFTLPLLDGKNPLADRIRAADPKIAFNNFTIE